MTALRREIERLLTSPRRPASGNKIDPDVERAVAFELVRQRADVSSDPAAAVAAARMVQAFLAVAGGDPDDLRWRVWALEQVLAAGSADGDLTDRIPLAEEVYRYVRGAQAINNLGVTDEEAAEMSMLNYIGSLATGTFVTVDIAYDALKSTAAGTQPRHWVQDQLARLASRSVLACDGLGAGGQTVWMVAEREKT